MFKKKLHIRALEVKIFLSNFRNELYKFVGQRHVVYFDRFLSILLVFGALKNPILVNLPFLFLLWCKNFHKTINNHSDYFLSVIFFS